MKTREACASAPSPRARVTRLRMARSLSAGAFSTIVIEHGGERMAIRLRRTPSETVMVWLDGPESFGYKRGEYLSPDAIPTLESAPTSPATDAAISVDGQGDDER